MKQKITMDKEIIIREGKREDCRELITLIKELADYQKASHGPNIDHTVLEKDGFDRKEPLFYTYVVESDGKLIGYALFFYFYSTWNGKALYLEDFYVKEEYRKQGIGKKLLKTIAQRAVKEDCCRLMWMTLNWNPAKEFYLKLGGIDTTETNDEHFFRLDRSGLEKLIHEC